MSDWYSVKIIVVKEKLGLFAMRLNINCLQIMMKGPHSRAHPRLALIASRHATRYLWIKLPRGHEAGGRVATPATRAICYFALSATRSLIKRPLRVVRPRHFSSGNVRHAATDGGRAVGTRLFFSPTSLSMFLLPRDSLCVWTLQDGLVNPRATGFRQSHSTSFREIRFFERNLSCYDVKLRYCFTRKYSSILDSYLVLCIARTYKKNRSSCNIRSRPISNAYKNEHCFSHSCFISLHLFLLLFNSKFLSVFQIR